MKTTTQTNSILMGALLGVMIAGPALGATIRYRQSGDWTQTAPLNDQPGWQNVSSVPTPADLGRINWGNNTVTLTTTETIGKLQVGVDEQGNVVIANGGTLTTVAGSGQNGDVTIGQGNNPAGTGTLTVESGGTLNVANILYHGNLANGTSDIFGTVNVTSHLWTGWTAGTIGTINVNNGGVLNVSGQLGLNWQNNGAVGYVNVKDGGVLNLSQIHPTDSIRGSSVLDISGSGVVTIPGDFTAVMSAYTNALRITAYGGLGTVGIDYNNTNVGKTTLFAIAPLEPPPTETVWNPAANPSGTGKWNEKSNWTGFVAPAGVTKAIFNVVGAIPCTVTNAAVADYVVMGDNGPGGTLIITNGGSLTCGAVNATAIGYNSNGVLVVETGGSTSFGTHLWIGLDPGSDGTLIMNGGTVSVAGMFGLGWQGGKGTAHINGGTLNLSSWDYFNSIQGESVLDISGTGKVVINGDQQASVNNFILTGQITNHAGTLVVDYNNIAVGKTTIYPAGIYLPPAQVTWNPALNLGDTDGLWNVSSNWTGGVGPSNVTIVRFSVLDAIPCTVTNAAFAKQMVMGVNGGPGGTLIITNGGNLTCSADEWTAIGYNNTAQLVVENGGAASFGNHLWIGFEATADGTLTMNGGTVSVTGMFGLGWGGGKGTANINGGTLNLNQWSASSPGSIAGTSLLNVAGTGKVVINGDQFTSVSNYVSAGKITANGGPNVFYSYDPGANKTTISAVLLPAPQQSITAVSVNAGIVSITYQTTHQHTYHIEGTPSLTPPAWTPVAGSTNAATGVPVTFTFPAGPGQMFYRTVSH